MPDLNNTTNCGIYEVSGVRSFTDGPSEWLRELRIELRDVQVDHGHDWLWPGMLLFSDARSSRSRKYTDGDHLAAYILDHRLGELTWTGWKRNPNTGNHIKMWVWYPNVRRCDSHLNQLGEDN